MRKKIRYALFATWVSLLICFLGGCRICPIKGPSMFPAIQTGDWVILVPCSSPLPGDIVSFVKSEKLYIKRVIGIPGDTITMVGISVYRNHTLVDEDYVVIRSDMPFRVWELAKDEYFVLGDNRPISYDSEDFGPIKKDTISYKVVGRLLPILR